MGEGPVGTLSQKFMKRGVTNRLNLRLLWIALTLSLTAAVLADNGTLTISALPPMALADGRTPVTFTVEVRDSTGRYVPDGTQVLFETNLGTFRQNVVTTQSGIARATLIASGTEGVARIRITAPRFNTTDIREYEFVSDPGMLSAAREFIEVTSEDRDLVYSTQFRILEASSDRPNGVVLRYRDITIRAQDIQLEVPTYIVRARNARITMGGIDQLFSELYFVLNRRNGGGMTETDTTGVRMVPEGYFVRPEPAEGRRVAFVEISAGGLRPLDRPIPGLFNFLDISDTLSTVEARRATIFPQREIQFVNPNIKVEGQSVIRVPRIAFSATTSTPIITEQFFSISNNNFAVNFPYYVDLRPGMSQLFRLEYGRRYNTGFGAAGGLFLSYEMNWNQGVDMEGGIALRGLNRNDWGISARQFWQPDPQTTFQAQLEMPAQQSIFGTVNASRSFDGFSATASTNYTTTLRGLPATSQRHELLLESDPIPVPGLASNLFVGASYEESRFSLSEFSNAQSSYGARARLNSRPLRLWQGGTFSGSFTANQRQGRNVPQSLTTETNLSLTSAIAPGMFGQVGYSFVDDPFQAGFLGRHRLTTETFYTQGALNASLFLSQSLDVDRRNINTNLSLRVSDLWRFRHSFLLDQFAGQSFGEQNFLISYRIGFQEVGISYSTRTNRFGIEIIGTTFD